MNLSEFTSSLLFLLGDKWVKGKENKIVFTPGDMTAEINQIDADTFVIQFSSFKTPKGTEFLLKNPPIKFTITEKSLLTKAYEIKQRCTIVLFGIIQPFVQAEYEYEKIKEKEKAIASHGPITLTFTVQSAEDAEEITKLVKDIEERAKTRALRLDDYYTISPIFEPSLSSYQIGGYIIEKHYSQDNDPKNQGTDPE